jgi:hypothetical protein
MEKTTDLPQVTDKLDHIYNYLLYNCEKMQLIDGASQKHRPLVFLAGLLLVKEYATYVKFHTGSEI